MASYVIVIVALVTGILGFVLGSIKFHREEKYRAYREYLSPIVRFPFEGDNKDAYNEAMQKLWIFASEKVARKMNIVASRVIDPNRGDVLEALQEMIAAMRNDIQLWSWGRIEPPDIAHFYTIVSRNVSPGA
jgi:hypothetical protein